MFFGIAGDADSDVRVAPPNEGHQLVGVAQSAGGRRKTVSPSGGSPRRAMMLRMSFFVAWSSHSSICAGSSPDAREVRRRRQTESLLDLDAPVDGPRAVRPPGPVGARDEDRAIGGQAAQRAAQTFIAVGRLGRKDLDRHAAAAVAIHLSDSHKASRPQAALMVYEIFIGNLAR